MKKILLVGGDSFSDQSCSSYKGKDILTWPVLLAEKLNMNLVCVASAGGGNEQIYSSIQDWVCTHIDHPHPKDIGMVIAAWSKAERMDFEIKNHFAPFDRLQSGDRRTWENTRVSPRGGIFHFMRKSVRNFHNLQMLCESNNIPYKQFQALSLFRDYINEYHRPNAVGVRLKCIDYISESAQFRHINKDNFIGWPLYDEAGGFTVGDLRSKKYREAIYNLANISPYHGAKDVDCVIGPNDTHPNKIGHELIAEFIYENL